MSDEPLNGLLILSDPSDEVTQECFYQNGLLEKKLKIFIHQKIYMETDYVQGKKNGFCSIYDDTGNVMLRQHYKNDQLHGLSYFYQHKKIIEKTLYREGNLIRKLHYGEKPKFIT